MTQKPDVLIVGGGVIGLSAAYFLARAGVQVQVIDKGDFGQESSWAGAGILPPGNPTLARTPFDLLRAQSAALFPSLSAELRDLTGIDNGFLRCGGLEFLGKGSAAAAEEWRGEGIEVQTLAEKDLQKLEPGLALGLGTAVFLPDMAQLRNPRHVKALIAACQAKGVRFKPGCPAHGWLLDKRRLLAVNTLDGPLSAGKYVLATGAWTDPLLEPLAWRPGIRPVRGQIALLNSGPPVVKHILLWGARYLVPRPDGLVLLGSTEEHVGFDRRTTAAAISELVQMGISLVPALADAHVEKAWAGLRPGSPDGLPFIGPVPGHSNVYVAAGHYRAGIQLSPGTALLLKEMILDLPRTLPAEPFRVGRTASISVPEEARGVEE